MANLTEYDLSGINGGSFVSILQSINQMSGGIFGISLLLIINFILFTIMLIFTDAKTAFIGTSFTSLLMGFIFLGMGILAPSIFILLVVLVIIILIIITR